MRSKHRHTKIVCTIGPATASVDGIRSLGLAGMDVARLNFSHGDHVSHRQTIQMIRQISRELGREVGILQDLGGPKIRLGTLPDRERELSAGETVNIGPEKMVQRERCPHLARHRLQARKAWQGLGAVMIFVIICGHSSL